MARRRSGIGVALALAIAAGAGVGCGSSAAGNPPAANAAAAATPEDEAASSGLSEHHRHHHHGGVTLLIALSLDTIGGEPQEHAAIEKIKADLHAKMEPARAAEQALHAALADGIAAGAIDKAKVDAALAQVTATAATVHDATTDALNQLHAALTPPQRAALVDKVEAHWEVWQKANAFEQKEATGQPRKGGHLAKLASEIGLTQDQLDKIHASLDAAAKPPFDPQKVGAHIKAFGDAFRAQTFDAKTLTTGGEANAHLATFGAARMVRFYEAVDPVLTADQRAKLAAILKEHASYNPGAAGG
jgi:Spy/CpxP family protein refolding chaperone